MQIKLVFLIIVLLAFFCFSIKAQNNTLEFHHCSTVNGLSNTESTCIIQDREGFIWIGTNDGLNRYDGINFKVYRKDITDSTSICDNSISTLFIDSNGNLWIGSQRNGLCLYDKKKDCFKNFKNSANNNRSLIDNDVESITEDCNNDIWIATYYGLNKYNPGSNDFDRLEISNVSNQKYKDKYLAEAHLKYVNADKNGNIWIAYSNRIVSKYNVANQTFRHYSFAENKNTTDKYMFAALLLKDDFLLVGTHGDGLWKIDTVSGNWEKDELLKIDYVKSIFEDSKNRIWIGGLEHGLIQYDLNTKKINTHTHNENEISSLSSNSINTIYEDKQQTLWIGCNQGTLDYTVSKSPFESFSPKNNNIKNKLKHPNVSAVFEKNGIIWIGYYNLGGIEIVNLRNNQRNFIKPEESESSLGEGTVQCIFSDSKENIWIGTYLGGLQKYDPTTGKFTTYRNNPDDEQSIAGNDVRKIAEDSKGNLWLAIHGGGIDKFDTKTNAFTHFKINYNNKAETINSDWTLTLLVDNEDNVWVGSVNGVCIISANTYKIKKFKKNKNSQIDQNRALVFTIFQDSNMDIWIGSNEGLFFYKKSTNAFERFTTENGLSNNNVTGILEDNNHDLWLSTFNGLSKFTPSSEYFVSYNYKDGLLTDEFNYAACYKSNNNLFFGGRLGLVFFNTENIINKALNPTIAFTAFKLFGELTPIDNLQGSLYSGFKLNNHINYCDKLELKHNQNGIGFEFTSINFANPERDVFAYMLEGFDKKWNVIGKKREATYTNLPFGDYLFNVKVANSDGTWNNKIKSIKIIIHPPIWRTIVAYIIYFLFIISLLWWFRYYILNTEKKRQMLELDALKIKFFNNISHEFRTPLTLIVGPIEKLLNSVSDEKLHQQYQLINVSAKRLLKLINQLMDLPKIENNTLAVELSNEDIVGFVSAIAYSYSNEAHERKIRYVIISNVSTLALDFDTDKLDKILYNLLSNAFKFTPDNGEISIDIKIGNVLEKQFVSGSELVISVNDSGIGISSDELSTIFDRFVQAKSGKKNKGTGIGLSYSRDLALLQKGQLMASSELGKGSCFTLRLPIGEVTIMSEMQKYETIISSPIVLDNVHSKINKSKLPLLLIIEDNYEVRSFIKNEMGQHFRIIDAINGRIGIDIAQAKLPDLIISDIMMPEMDGFEVCKVLKTEDKTSHIPIILLTARSADKYAIEGLEIGADEYITKPFNPIILLTRAKNLIESRRKLRLQFSKLPDISNAKVMPTTLDEKFLYKTNKIIQKRLNNSEFNATQFAEEIGMSRSQLYRKLDALTGLSVNELLRLERLKKATELLVTRNYNVSDVAFLVGFNDVNYFTRSFSKQYGIAPSKYADSLGR